MKRICWLLIFSSMSAMEKINIPPAKSVQDLISEENLTRAISNYFKTHDQDLCTHLQEPLKKRLEESSENLETTTAHVRDSNDLEKLTQSLITDLLKEALTAKHLSDIQEKPTTDNKKLFYAAATGLITTITGILATYFLSNK